MARLGGPTAIQRQLMEFIAAHQAEDGAIPTLREMCAAFGWRSTGTARDHLKALEKKGLLTLGGGLARSVRLRKRIHSTGVPLLGRIVAGDPLENLELVDGWIQAPEPWLRRRTCFALRVKGDSMEGAGILDDDMVVVEKRAVAHPGEIVVAAVGDETTVKRLHRRGDEMFLEPENPRYEAIPLDREDARVLGVVVGLLRSYDSRPLVSV